MLNPTNIYTLKKGCENRIFGFPQKYVKTTQDSTQMTFGCQIWPRPLFWTSEVTRGRRGHPRSRSNLTSWGQGKSFEYHIWGSSLEAIWPLFKSEAARGCSSDLEPPRPPYMILKWLAQTSGCQIWPRGGSRSLERPRVASDFKIGRTASRLLSRW